ncbi:hypothetical protein NFI96_001437, partial [Prochilodus magdalenae]
MVLETGTIEWFDGDQPFVTVGSRCQFKFPELTERRILQRVINTAQKIISYPLPCLEDLFSSRCLNRAANILKDRFHPGHHLFKLTRYKREDSKAQTALCLPLVDNLLKDNTDGCALAALLHFYCPKCGATG